MEEQGIDKYCSCGFGDEFFIVENNIKYCNICSKKVMPPNVKAKYGIGEGLVPSKAKNTENILIVDDQDFFRKILEDILTGNGYQVSQAKTGLEAIKNIIDYIRQGNKTSPPPMVILDLNMPGLLDGVQTLGVLKTIEQQLIVLILTSTPPNKNLLGTLGKLGAKKYINKKAANLDTLLLSNLAAIKKTI